MAKIAKTTPKIYWMIQKFLYQENFLKMVQNGPIRKVITINMIFKDLFIFSLVQVFLAGHLENFSKFKKKFGLLVTRRQVGVAGALANFFLEQDTQKIFATTRFFFDFFWDETGLVPKIIYYYSVDAVIIFSCHQFKFNAILLDLFYLLF